MLPFKITKSFSCTRLLLKAPGIKIYFINLLVRFNGNTKSRLARRGKSSDLHSTVTEHSGCELKQNIKYWLVYYRSPLIVATKTNSQVTKVKENLSSSTERQNVKCKRVYIKVQISVNTKKRYGELISQVANANKRSLVIKFCNV